MARSAPLLDRAASPTARPALPPEHLLPGARWVPTSRYGYPDAAERRVQPTILLVVHSTRIDDRSGPILPARCEAETLARGDREVSATFINDRDGRTVQCLDPVRCAPWTNGILRSRTSGTR